MKNTKYDKKWMDDLETIYDFIKHSIVSFINHNNTINHQISMSQRMGGLGLRSPSLYYSATRLSVLYSIDNKIEQYFNFDMIHNKDDIIQSNDILSNTKRDNTLNTDNDDNTDNKYDDDDDIKYDTDDEKDVVMASDQKQTKQQLINIINPYNKSIYNTYMEIKQEMNDMIMELNTF